MTHALVVGSKRITTWLQVHCVRTFSPMRADSVCDCDISSGRRDSDVRQWEFGPYECRELSIYTALVHWLDRIRVFCVYDWERLAATCGLFASTMVNIARYSNDVNYTHTRTHTNSCTTTFSCRRIVSCVSFASDAVRFWISHKRRT